MRERRGCGLSWAAWADSLLASNARRSMAHDFRCPDRRQSFLLPPDMRDWLPEDDIVHLILDAVAPMDLAAFEAAHKLGGAGQAPFAPAVLLSVLVYAYSHGVRPSRAIERLCGRDAGFRFIVGEHVPDHTGIARTGGAMSSGWRRSSCGCWRCAATPA